MDLSTLGQACEAFCAIADPRARAHHPVRQWLTQYRHFGVFPLVNYGRPTADGYRSAGSAETVNWLLGDEVYLGYPSEQPGGALNYRYEVPVDAMLPGNRFGAEPNF
jgi:hypothetical protein